MLIALICAAAVAGATGSWSPCGLSMIDTLGPRGHSGSSRVTAAACAAFVPGAMLGGVLTFGLLALIGSGLGGGQAALGVGAALVMIAAALEARGTPITPQIRRQVPEPWRRVLPLPVASAGYGVLLGMGFTTYVLTFAVPALAGAALAIGDPLTGVVVGLAFGAGRALPIVVLAPLSTSPRGVRAIELMVERPAVLRTFRLADAVVLAGCAAVMGAESAGVVGAAVVLLSPSGTDPTIEGDVVAWQTPGGSGRLQRGASVEVLGGTNPAVGGVNIASRSGSVVTVQRVADGSVVTTVDGSGSGAVAVSDGWLVLRVSTAAGDRLEAVSLLDGSRRAVAKVAAPSQLGRPALEGNRLVFHEVGRRLSRLREINLLTGKSRVLRSTRSAVFLNPTLLGEQLLYVDSSYRRQRLKLGVRLGRRSGRYDKTVYSIPPTARRDVGYERGRHPHHEGYEHGRRPKLWQRPDPGVVMTLWSTALGSKTALVARLRHEPDGKTASELLEVDL